MDASPRRQITAWCLYDFANSGYSAVIMTAIFAPYYTSVIVGNEMGMGDVWWARVSAVSVAFVALTSPFLGGIADAGGLRKRLWMGYTYLCILTVMGFTLLEPGMAVTGFILAALANIGMEGSMVFYNAYLPQLATSSMQGRISGWGFAVGYAGSIVALVAALPFTDPFRGTPIWLLVAIQFALFSLPAFLWLPGGTRSSSLSGAARQGFASTFTLLRCLWARRNARRFLLAYLFYEDGVTTVLIFASVFAATTLRMETTQLVLLFLVVQVSALIGATLMAKPTDTKGPRFVVMVSLVLWCGVTTAAYFVQTQGQYWVIAVTAGLGLGSVQAASRAFYARFIPPGEETQYFGLYAMVGKSAAIMGPLLFGEISYLYGGNQRPAVLSITVLLLIGLFFLYRVEEPKPI